MSNHFEGYGHWSGCLNRAFRYFRPLLGYIEDVNLLFDDLCYGQPIAGYST